MIKGFGFYIYIDVTLLLFMLFKWNIVLEFYSKENTKHVNYKKHGVFLELCANFENCFQVVYPRRAKCPTTEVFKMQ